MQVELKSMLDNKPQYQKHLFQKGFLITDAEITNMTLYPFYGNWTVEKLSRYYFVINKEVPFFYSEDKECILYIIGHAYNPFDMEYDEKAILEKLIKLHDTDFWRYESELTGIYVMGKITKDGIIYHWSDCSGMRISYYGLIDGRYYITSHANIVAYLCDLPEDRYITNLKKSRYFHLFGNILPGDLSAYSELKRTVPNHFYNNDGIVKRFFPIEPLKECETEDDYQEVLSESARMLKNTMILCSKKWEGKNIAISVTGGKDSGETLASANGNYEKFQYFSYISKPEEALDANAAEIICKKLDLKHRIINIPDNNSLVDEFDLLNEIVYCNGGNIGYIKPNEIRKRSVLINDNKIDLEVKSWVNEITRAYWYKKYAKTHFPQKPTGRYLATLYKVFVENRLLFVKTSKVFDDYIRKYMTDADIKLIGDWTTLWSWEFGFSAGEGQSLFAEHILSYDITIPFNNRQLVYLMLRPKLQDRIADRLQGDIIKVNNPEQDALHIRVVNAAHTRKRALMERLYLFINTHLPF